MPKGRIPSPIEWIGCIAMLLAGLSVLGIGLFAHLYGTTAESELTLVEGVPVDVKVSEIPRRRGANARVLKFTVSGQPTQYSDDAPNFGAVLAAANGGVPVQLWVSTKQETVFPRSGWAPIYKLRVDGRQVLSYSEVVGRKPEQLQSVLILGGVLFVAGAWGTLAAIYMRIRNSQCVSTSDPENVAT